MAAIPRELEMLADLCGVLTSYEDVLERRRHVSVETVFATLDALGVEVSSVDGVPRALEAERLRRLERGVEPVIVAWDGEPAAFWVALPAGQAQGTVACVARSEDGGEEAVRRFDLDDLPSKTSSDAPYLGFQLRTPGKLDPGYHHLRIEAAGETRESLVIAAPRRAYSATTTRDWGCFLPLYSLYTEESWGAGNFTDLEKLSAWVGRLGGRVVGTLPLLAAFLDEPCEPSPYAPASRLAWNELYIDLARVPDLGQCTEAAELLESAAFRGEIAGLQKSEHVEYRRLMALKRRALELLSETFFQARPQRRWEAFERFLAERSHLEDYAEFRATQERRKAPWPDWPSPLRDGRLNETDYDGRNKRYHLYTQWIATEQLETLADAAAGGLYLDLPLGVRPDGYDVWRRRDVYAAGASAGSPPDPVWTKGQDWSFPPLDPRAIRASGYEHVQEFLAHHLRLARLLRIDHVMQLHRLWWIPRGMRADQGAYVRYPADELYAVLSLQSHRFRTTLIGENLGTVPPEVDSAMEEHNVRPMYVVQYEVDRSEEAGALPTVPSGALAALNTHDMPTFAAWWAGSDVLLRQELGLIDEKQAWRERRSFERTKASLTAWLRSGGWLAEGDEAPSAVLLAILTFLAAGPAGLVLVNLEDLWEETRPQNIPGAGPERPNWRRKAAHSFETFSRHPDVLDTLRRIAELRQAFRPQSDEPPPISQPEA